MRWVCPDDRAQLAQQSDGLACRECGRVYPVVEGVPLFVRSEGERRRVQRVPPELDELWRAAARSPVEEALAPFCKRHGYSRSPYSADWKFFFAIPEGGTTLELGAGVGDDCVDLAARGGRTISMVPSVTHARIVGKHVRERTGEDWPVAVTTDVTRLPLADSSVNAVALEDAAAPAFGLSTRRFDLAAAEWQRVLAPGGVVFLGLANPLHRLPGVGGLRSALRVRRHPAVLNRVAKRWSVPDARPRLGVRHVTRTMTSLGFAEPIVYAPLPDEDDTRVVIPVEDAPVVRYFLNNLIRKNSWAVRLALRLLHVSVTLRLFRWLVPYYYLVFHKRA